MDKVMSRYEDALNKELISILNPKDRMAKQNAYQAISLFKRHLTSDQSSKSRKNGSWKNDKATDKQVAYLNKLGKSELKSGMTKGEASKMIDGLKNARPAYSAYTKFTTRHKCDMCAGNPECVRARPKGALKLIPESALGESKRLNNAITTINRWIIHKIE